MSEVWALPATDLAARIARGEISSAEAVEAHIARIEAVDAKLRATVVRRFDEARAQARAADERRARGANDGPLHGVPVSVKESLDVAGTPATFGLPSRANDRAVADDPAVERWRAAGAIVVAKTNVPQLLIFIETDNPLYGRTNNPWNLERSPGGSSGGEAALIAAGGSPLGLGSDIGGSLRVPAAFCGIASLKPTAGTLDDGARLPIYAGQRAIVSQTGPLARTAADVALGFAVAAATTPVFPRGVRGLRVGFYERAGAFAPAPAIARAAREAAGALADLGARVVPFEPPRVDAAMDLFYGILSADGGAGALDALGDDPRDARVETLLAIVTKPRRFVVAVERVLRVSGQRGLARMVRNYGFRDAHHYWKLVEAQRAYAAIFAHAIDAIDGGPLDLIVAPPAGLAAIPHGRSADVSTAGAYAPLYNLLGYPCGTLPWTRVRREEETGRAPSRDRMENGALACERGSAGMPAGVQLIGRPGCEEAVLNAMLALETVARERPDYPRTPLVKIG